MAAFSGYRVIPTSKGNASDERAHSWSNGVRLEALGNLAHELRTPVQVLQGYLEILRDDLAGELSDEPREIIDRMNSNIHDLALTVENVMEFAMAEADSEPHVDEVFEVRDLFDEVIPVLEAGNGNKSLEIKVSLSDSVRRIRCARRPLKVILSNLASNALKFTGSGCVTISVTEDPAQNGTEAIALEVTDTGPGIEPELLDRAFESLQQLSASSARRFRGLGLGLAVVRRNVRLLGGTLEVQTAAGKGCAFKVTVPCRIIRRAETGKLSRTFTSNVRISDSRPAAITHVKAIRRVHKGS